MPNQPDVQQSRSPRKAPRAVWLWGPVVAYMVVIFGLSSASSVPVLPGGMSDKAAHSLLYSGLGVLMVRALARGCWSGVRPLALVGAVACAALYGLTDEVHQLYVPGREFDLLDLAADGFGAGAAAGAIWAWSIIRRFSGSQPGHA